MSALDVARRRGYADIVELLVAAGAVSSIIVEADPLEVQPGATGIKAIDLWCPLPERGLAHLTPGLGIGAMVLIAELSHRAAKTGRPVVWTGFVPAPTDLGDVHHGLAESDIADVVTVSMAEPTAPVDEQVAALDRGITIAGDDAFLVVFTETGHTSAIDERLPALAARDALTLVVSPLDGSVPPPKPAGSPYLASITFDIERAKRGRWPAISATSWSKVADGEIASLADQARSNMTDAIDDYLSQPFFIAEPVMGKPGESVAVADLRSGIERLLVSCDAARAVGVDQ